MWEKYSMVKNMEMEHYSIIKIFLKETSRMMIFKVVVLCTARMEINMKESGERMKKMDMEGIHGKMGAIMRGLIGKAKGMDMEHFAKRK